jgi:outer membrane protein assembly factor BamE
MIKNTARQVKMKLKNLLFFPLIFCIAFAISACSQSTWLYRMNIQQGNILTTDLARSLHKGMSKEAVCEVLGPPLLVDAFNENRWTYIYAFRTGKGLCVDRCLTIYFRNNHICYLKTKNL